MVRAGAITAAVAWLVGAVLAPVTGYAQAQMDTKVHDLGLFTIAVPAAWQIKPPTGDTAIQAISPAEAGALPDTVEVNVRNLPSNVTDAKGCESTVKWVMRVFLHVNYTTLHEGPATIGGAPAYTHTYTWSAKTGQSRWSTQACVVDRGKAFVLTGTTANEPPSSPARGDAVMTILNSFKLTRAAGASQP
jgi:hypothetical protein